MSTQTAAQAYQARTHKIEQHLSEIRKELNRHHREFKRDGGERDWGYVGDLGHIEDLLHQIEAFLKNEDIDG